MSQNGARKPKSPAEEDDKSFLDEAFDERTVVGHAPLPPEMPAPPTAPPQASAKKLEFDHTPISQNNPMRSLLDEPMRNTIDEAFDARTMVIPPKSARQPEPAPQSVPQSQQVTARHDVRQDVRQEAPRPETPPPSPRKENKSPKESDFDFGPPPILENTPTPSFAKPQPEPRKAAAQQPAPKSGPPPVRSESIATDETQIGKNTGSISFDQVRSQGASAQDDWNFRRESTQPGGVPNLLKKAKAFPVQHKIAIALVIVLPLVFFLLKGSGKFADASNAEDETKTAEATTAKNETHPDGRATASTVESVLQLFDIAYSKTQGQARSDSGSP